jgi:hypothetical protein
VIELDFLDLGEHQRLIEDINSFLRYRRIEQAKGQWNERSMREPGLQRRITTLPIPMEVMVHIGAFEASGLKAALMDPKNQALIASKLDAWQLSPSTYDGLKKGAEMQTKGYVFTVQGQTQQPPQPRKRKVTKVTDSMTALAVTYTQKQVELKIAARTAGEALDIAVSATEAQHPGETLEVTHVRREMLTLHGGVK